MVLDTNVLRAPYGMSKKTLDALRPIYQNLAKAGSLFIPEQVAREFAPGRAEELIAIYQSLESRRINIKEKKPSILEVLPEYDQLLALEQELEELNKNHRKLLNKLLTQVRELNWNDEVSKLYNDIFKKDTIIKLKKNHQEITEGHDYRFKHDIPPGFADKRNPYGGIGDYLIWLSILQLGETLKKDVIFVSEETKSDWWHIANGQPLYPRFELVDEFRLASGGCAFRIIKFADLLKLFGAAPAIIEEARQHKIIPPSPGAYSNIQDDSSSQSALSLGIANWLGQEGFEVNDINMNGQSATFRNKINGKILCVDMHFIYGLYDFQSLLISLETHPEEYVSRGSTFIFIIASQSRELAQQAYNRIRDPRRLPFKMVIGALIGQRFEPIKPFQDLNI